VLYFGVAVDPSLRERLAAIARSPIGLSLERLGDLLTEREVDVGGLDDERLAELCLAIACGEGDEAAVAHFTQTYADEVRRVAQRAVGNANADDLAQRVLTRLLVPSSHAPPRIASFLGSGSLRGFVRMTSSRVAIDALRANKVHPEDRSVSALADRDDAFEQLELAEVRDRMSVALGDALRTLKPLERRVLRMRFVLGFSVRRTAMALDLHHNSVSRLVARARERLLDHLHQDPDLPTHPSGLVAVAEALDVSVSRYLESHPEIGASSDP
jgi:RNA polymerase sigma-70 factor